MLFIFSKSLFISFIQRGHELLVAKILKTPSISISVCQGMLSLPNSIIRGCCEVHFDNFVSYSVRK